MIQSQLAPCQESENVSISIEQRVIGFMRTTLAATTARLSGGAIFGAAQERGDVGFQMQMQGLGSVLGGGKQAVWLSLEICGTTKAGQKSRRLGCQRIANHQNCLLESSGITMFSKTSWALAGNLARGGPKN
jgi:hypothetical protein